MEILYQEKNKVARETSETTLLGNLTTIISSIRYYWSLDKYCFNPFLTQIFANPTQMVADLSACICVTSACICVQRVVLKLTPVYNNFLVSQLRQENILN